MNAKVMPGGLRDVPCESQVSKLVRSGKRMGGAEGELQKRKAQSVNEEQRQTLYSKVMVDHNVTQTKVR